MSEVNIKFKPEEWYGGYVSKFATETEYNNAFKLLPNVSKIGNNEIRYIPRDIAQLPEAYLWIDNFGRSNTDYLNSNEFNTWINTLSGINSDMGDKKYQLIGCLYRQNTIDDRNTKLYLWKLIGTEDYMRANDYSEYSYGVTTFLRNYNISSEDWPTDTLENKDIYFFHFIDGDKNIDTYRKNNIYGVGDDVVSAAWVIDRGPAVNIILKMIWQ